MDLESAQRRRERSFDMPLSDLGEPDHSLILPWWIANGSPDGDPLLTKWIVQEADGGVRMPELMHMEGGDGFYVHVEGHESEPHEAEVHFTGKLLDGTVLSSSRENDIPLTFKLIRDNVMEGFRLAITSMQAGEKAVFTIHQDWAVTKSGCLANIPWNMPFNQMLRFDIELISLITDIFDDQGIIKKTIKFGKGNLLPLDQDEVLVKYSACMEDGALVSESEGVEFSLAEGFFCSAFAHVVKTMTAGEEAFVVIKPEYGFGEQGRPSMGKETSVPPNATLLVKLQLISWKKVTHLGENREIVKRRLYKGNRVLRGLVPYNGDVYNGDVVEVRLIGKLQDGTVFDCRGHNGDDPLEFTIGEGSNVGKKHSRRRGKILGSSQTKLHCFEMFTKHCALKRWLTTEHAVYGLHKAVMTMTEGEVTSFTIPPEHAFGTVGSDQYRLAVIPPNSVVTYEIELLSVMGPRPCSASIPRLKNRHEVSEGRIFVPPLAARPEANVSRAISTAPTTTGPVSPEASPVGSNSSTAGNENQSAGATGGTKRKASLLRSCFGYSSSK